MSVSSSLNITELIDRCPLGPLQIRIIVLCGLVALLDGFDLLAIGVAAPIMAGPLHIAPNQFGFVFSAALVCTASAATPQQMLLFRFLAGVGLGGAMPSFISLAAEYTPRSNRQAVIGLLWTGFPLGGVMVGLLASRLINAVGLQSLFYIGGILPLGLSIVLIRVGWAMGLGRLGSFVGPLAIGLLVNRGWQIGDCFAALGTAALYAASAGGDAHALEFGHLEDRDRAP